MKTLASLLLAGLLGSGESEQVTQKLPSSCKDLADGVHYIQPLSVEQVKSLAKDNTRTAPPVKVQCSSGYTIIDPSYDSNIQEYFSSFHPYHKAFAGPDLDDHVVWRKWFLPSRIDQKMIFTPSTDDCSACTDPSDYEKAGQTAYYMTGDLIGCNWPTKNLCSFDLDTLECSKCAPASFTSIGDDSEMWGTCGQMPYHVDFPIVTDHDSCTEGISTVLPSIGRTGHACVCYKPTISIFNTAEDFELDTSDSNLETEQEFYDDSNHIVKLSNDDFVSGTYRIKTPGTYQLTEDIIFDFNAGDLDSPNDADAWFPMSSQSEEYPGAGELDGWYWLGFYAGITVECDDVVIDLNGYSIQQSDAFYLQQRWFVGILLANKPFIDTQGPTWTGVGVDSPSNVVIKDGTIGLSSHHGILAIRTENVKIQNVHIKDFETHGVAFNEFYDLTLENVEIGPSTTKCFVNGRYSLARMELPILRAAAEDFGSETIDSPKYGTISFNDLLDKLIDQLDMVFNYVYFGTEYSGSEWEDAYNTFVNPSGVSVGGAVYGAVFRPRGASVMNFGKYDQNGYSERLNLLNVNIHDLAVETEEIPTFGTEKEMWVRDSINAPVPFVISTHNKLSSVPEMKYAGNLWTDIVVALKKHASSWWHLGRMSVSSKVVDWAESGKAWQEHEDSETIHCNMDSLGHLVKGVLAMKMEYVEDVSITNLEISNIAALSPLGSTVCGAYHDGTDGGHALQAKVTNEGWGGTNSYGIWFTSVKNVELNGLQMSNMVSYHGRIFGLRGYESSHEITLKSAWFSNFFAGALLDDTVGYEDDWPNAKASACAVEDDEFIGTNDDVSVNCMAARGTCSCDSVSCAGTIDEYCDGFEIETPKHVLSFGADNSISNKEKVIAMNIGERLTKVDNGMSENIVKQFSRKNKNKKSKSKKSEKENDVANDEENEDDNENDNDVDGDDGNAGSLLESKSHKANNIWLEYWKRYWVFFIVGLVGIAAITFIVYKVILRAQSQMRNAKITENHRRENIRAASQGLVFVEDDSEEDY